MNGEKGQGRFERRLASLEEKERSKRTVVAALREIATNLAYIGDVIRQSKGDMTADEEKAFLEKTGATVDEIRARHKANADALAQGMKVPDGEKKR